MRKHLFYFLLMLFTYPLTTSAQDINQLEDWITRKDYQTALSFIESIDSVDTLSCTSLSLMGQIYEDLTRYKDALSFYQKSFAKDTTQTPTLYALSRISLNMGDGGLAKKYLNTILEQDSMNFYANYQLGGLNFSLGNYQDALEYYRKLYESGNQTPTIKRKMGDCYYHLSNFDGAALMYFNAFNENRHNAMLASSLINLLYHMGEKNYDDAIAICDTALAYNPEHKILLRDRGMGAYLKKDYEIADSLFSTLLEKGDSSLLNLKYAGLARVMRELYIDAIPIMEKAYEANKKDVEVVLTLASIYGFTYERDLGLQLLDSAEVLLYPTKTQRFVIAKTRGDIYARKVNYSQSIRYLKKACQIFPRRYDVINALNQSLFTLIGKDLQSATEKHKELYLWSILELTQNLLDKGIKEPAIYKYYLYTLNKFKEDAFFAEKEILNYKDPFEKKGSISMKELNDLINKLPKNSEL